MATVAEQLREAREKMNLSVYDVADVTKIRTDHLRALEEGNYQVFAAPVYIRGFVRSYGTMLKLNVVTLMDDLDEELSGEEKFSEPPSLTGKKKSAVDRAMLLMSKMNWLWITIALVVVFSLVTASIAYRSWQSYKTRDPLSGLSSGIVQPESEVSGELLPLPK
ncbi:MAG: helix-turn-helix domain-containing protein [Verrucomicrobia bacterium]|nr:helix-turn-helix domain-containing protein [Verrucomicrobiota bacterium]